MVIVENSNGIFQPGLKVYAFDGSTYAGFSGITNVQGQAILTLPAGNYRFRADQASGAQYWSGNQNHCTTPGCMSANIQVTPRIIVSVHDADGEGIAGVDMAAYDGPVYTGFGSSTDENGDAVFALPAGSYRFRINVYNTTFWSGTENHCTVPDCESAAITAVRPQTVNVTVQDTDGSVKTGQTVYVFTGSTYAKVSAVTDANGTAAFSLPEGNYRFRTDIENAAGAGSVQYWSDAQNHCTLPGCTLAVITVTKPITVTVTDATGAIYAGLPVYAYSGINYQGYSAVTDAEGKAAFILPQGNYRFRTEREGASYWSDSKNTCAIPGCEAAVMIVPDSSGLTRHTIDYTYDALRRLTSATYSDGIEFHYTYDAAGNVLEYTTTIEGMTTLTTYTYDAANQLLTATQGSVTWHYTYDGNGSLIQTTPGEEPANGAKRYTYDTAGFLLRVESHNGTAWQNQAEMLYDGLGNRLEMTATADGQSVTTRYEMDNGRVLAACQQCIWLKDM